MKSVQEKLDELERSKFCGFGLLNTSGIYLIPPFGCDIILAGLILYKFQKVE